ncbi:MAG: hypothetical protein J7J46_08005 [Candidatus Desulfofervidus sp.]|nr:hypothetical protein [Candidatus Desulfofervidus sp.]
MIEILEDYLAHMTAVGMELACKVDAELGEIQVPVLKVVPDLAKAEDGI